MSKNKPKKSKRKYRIIYLSIFLLAIICVGALVFALYKLNTEYIPQQKEAQRFEELRQLAYTDEIDPSEPSGSEPSDDDQQQTPLTTSTGYVIPHYTLEQLFGMNSDMVGWMTIPDTVVDYPVMHTPDDVEFYLHTDFDGYYSFSGCLFVGDHCDIDSDMFVIYGHNMNNGTMFGSIDYYLSEEYWSTHSDIIFRTRDETRIYKIFAAFPTKVYDEDDDSDDFKYYDSVGKMTKETYEASVKDINSLSALDTGMTPSYPAQIVFLSTCAYHDENGRFVLAAYRIS